VQSHLPVSHESSFGFLRLLLPYLRPCASKSGISGHRLETCRPSIRHSPEKSFSLTTFDWTGFWAGCSRRDHGAPIAWKFQYPTVEPSLFHPSLPVLSRGVMFFSSGKSRKPVPARFSGAEKVGGTCRRGFPAGKNSPPAVGEFFRSGKVLRHRTAGFSRGEKPAVTAISIQISVLFTVSAL
jgi:hypothetical protein